MKRRATLQVRQFQKKSERKALKTLNPKELKSLQGGTDSLWVSFVNLKAPTGSLWVS